MKFTGTAPCPQIPSFSPEVRKGFKVIPQTYTMYLIVEMHNNNNIINSIE